MKKLKINSTPKNLRMLISFLISLALFSSIGLANNYTCMDATTSFFSTLITVSGSSIPISYNETCKFGCQSESGKCKASPYDINIMDVGLLFGMIVFALLFFYLSFKLGTSEGAGESDLLKVQAFKTYFFLTGLFFLLASQLIMVNYVSLINKGSSMGFIQDMLWFILAITGISFVIIFVMILKDVINLMIQKKMFAIRW